MSQISLRWKDRYPIVLEMGFNFAPPPINCSVISSLLDIGDGFSLDIGDGSLLLIA